MPVHVLKGSRLVGPFERDQVIAWMRSGQLGPDSLGALTPEARPVPLRELLPPGATAGDQAFPLRASVPWPIPPSQRRRAAWWKLPAFLAVSVTLAVVASWRLLRDPGEARPTVTSPEDSR